MKKSYIKKIYVALSGGVDSSVAAALLLEKGYDVRGVFMRQYDYADVGALKKNLLSCAQEEDRLSALAVARHLDIPFFSWDFRKLYHEKVVDYLFKEYARGRTPNPDIMCNMHLKFGAFLKRALSEGADFIATGHYARLRRQIPNYKSQITNGNEEIVHLLKAKDAQKDQSYFLYALTQKQLRYSLFPIGEYQKSEVRDMAKKIGLPTWDRKDSQGICFVGDVSMQDFLQSRIPLAPGPIRTRDGKKIGTHKGVAYYTIGQRRGLGLPGGDGIYYVVLLNIKKNEVIVAQGKKDPHLFSKELYCSSIHWISGKESSVPFSCKARIRYRQFLTECTIQSTKNEKLKMKNYRIGFKKPQRAVAPGQHIVFYKGQECLGGGVIQSSLSSPGF